ncbi:MAG: AraC family transcriptional regulator [Muribaculum sp.]|nr:AraC family transcriptional regulator [Muribaculum sp.]
MNEIKLYKFQRLKYGTELKCDAMDFESIKPGIMEYPLHRESFFCFILVEDGTAILKLNGKEKNVEAKTIICGLPGEVWEWKDARNLAGKVVIFEPDFIMSAVKDPLLLQRPSFLHADVHVPFIKLSDKGFLWIRDIIVEMMEEIKSPVKFQDLLRAQLWHLILLIEKEYQMNPNSVAGELPQKNYAAGFVNLVGMALYKHHDVEYYADRLCITVNYLNKVSHAALGVSARKYVQGRIIAEAKNLLSITRMNVSQVADMLGFESSNYFIRFFRKQTGLTPGEYKESHQ